MAPEFEVAREPQVDQPLDTDVDSTLDTDVDSVADAAVDVHITDRDRTVTIHCVSSYLSIIHMYKIKFDQSNRRGLKTSQMYKYVYYFIITSFNAL